jgi:hypothetical protein
MPMNLLSLIRPTTSLQERIGQVNTVIAERIEPARAKIDGSLKANFPGAPDWTTASADMSFKSDRIARNGAPQHSMKNPLLAKVADMAFKSKAVKEARFLDVSDALRHALADLLLLDRLGRIHLEIQLIHQKLSSLGQPIPPLPSIQPPYKHVLNNTLAKEDHLDAHVAFSAQLPPTEAEQISMLAARFWELKRQLGELNRSTPSAFLLEAANSNSSLRHIRKFRERIAACALAEAIEKASAAGEIASGFELPEIFHPHLELYKASPQYQRAVTSLHAAGRPLGNDENASRIYYQQRHRECSKIARGLEKSKLVKTKQRLDHLCANRPTISMKPSLKPAGIWRRDHWDAVSPKELAARRRVYQHRCDELKHAHEALAQIEDTLLNLQTQVAPEAEPAQETLIWSQPIIASMAAYLSFGAAARDENAPTVPAAELERNRAQAYSNVTQMLDEVRKMKSEIIVPESLDSESPATASGNFLLNFAERILQERLPDGTTRAERIKKTATTLRMANRFPSAVKISHVIAQTADRAADAVLSRGSNSSRPPRPTRRSTGATSSSE